MIADELTKGGVYAIPLFEKLTELQANDLENCLIINLKRKSINLIIKTNFLFLGFNFGANVGGGRLTQRFIDLTEETRKQEIQQAYEDAMIKIRDTPIDRLVTSENAEVCDISFFECVKIWIFRFLQMLSEKIVHVEGWFK